MHTILLLMMAGYFGFSIVQSLRKLGSLTSLANQGARLLEAAVLQVCFVQSILLLCRFDVWKSLSIAVAVVAGIWFFLALLLKWVTTPSPDADYQKAWERNENAFFAALQNPVVPKHFGSSDALIQVWNHMLDAMDRQLESNGQESLVVIPFDAINQGLNEGADPNALDVRRFVDLFPLIRSCVEGGIGEGFRVLTRMALGGLRVDEDMRRSTLVFKGREFFG